MKNSISTKWVNNLSKFIKEINLNLKLKIPYFKFERFLSMLSRNILPSRDDPHVYIFDYGLFAQTITMSNKDSS